MISKQEADRQNEEQEKQIALRVADVSKCFETHSFQQMRHLPAIATRKLRASSKRTLARLKGQVVAAPAKPTEPTGFWANKDISFNVYKGEVLGIIGRNGSGKTTLLKMISRVTHPTTGEIEVHGKIGALLGVGTGFHPMFTGRDNVFMGGMILGLTREQVEERFEAILEFSEIGDFINRPVKTYSTGMRARLGFAVAVQLQPEILLLDEVLAVGDAGFQRKCLNEIVNMRKQGRTILFVSHNTNAVKAYCDRCILLEEGKIVRDGQPEDVISYYLSHMFESGRSSQIGDQSEREGSGLLRIEEFWFEDTLGRVVGNAVSGEACTLCLQYVCNVPGDIDNLSVGVAICDTAGRWLFRVSTEATDSDFATVEKTGTIRCVIPKLPLIQGEYGFGYRITMGPEVIDYVIEAGRFNVLEGDFFDTGKSETHSPILVEHHWSLGTADKPKEEIGLKDEELNSFAG